MTTRIRNTAIAFQFKSKYLNLTPTDRNIIIDEFINYLTLVNDAESLAWFKDQKTIREEGRSDMVCDSVWQTFYSIMMSSTPLRLGVEAFLFH